MLKANLEMLQADTDWRAETLALLDGLGRALHRTTRRLSALELGITEADVLKQNKALLERARAFLDKLQVAPADGLYDWLAQTEGQVAWLSEQREAMRALLERWLAWASTVN